MQLGELKERGKFGRDASGFTEPVDTHKHSLLFALSLRKHSDHRSAIIAFLFVFIMSFPSSLIRLKTSSKGLEIEPFVLLGPRRDDSLNTMQLSHYYLDI